MMNLKSNNLFWRDYIISNCKYIVSNKCFTLPAEIAVESITVGHNLVEQFVSAAVEQYTAQSREINNNDAEEFIEQFRKEFEKSFDSGYKSGQELAAIIMAN